MKWQKLREGWDYPRLKLFKCGLIGSQIRLTIMRGWGTMRENYFLFCQKYFLPQLCENTIRGTRMGIHLLYIPLLSRPAIFNKSNFYFYWLQYTQYLRTDLITKGLLSNLLPQVLGKWNTRINVRYIFV